jgi:hypothetical protein
VCSSDLIDITSLQWRKNAQRQTVTLFRPVWQ